MKLHQKISFVLFGLFLTIIILEIGLRIGGFAILSIQEYKNLQSMKQKGSFRIMCLGESTTQGQYPPYLEEILNQRNIGIKFSVIDKGTIGTSTAVILSQLETNLDRYQPDMVITMMGINDDGYHMPCEVKPASKTMSILKPLKVYKLARFIWLHMASKLKRAGLKDKFKEVPEKLDYIQQEQAFEKTLESNPNSDSAYIELARLFMIQGKFFEGEQALKKAIGLDLKNDSAHKELAWFYKDQGQFTESEQAFKKAIELNPNNDSAYTGLAWLYKDHGKYAESEQAFKKAVELNPNNDSAYTKLGWLYIAQGKFNESEQAFKKAVELDPKNERLYGSLAIVYYEMGSNDLYKIYAEKADSLRYKYYNPVTINNYHMLKQILDRRKIRLVCVQYPMRKIGPLKDILKEEMEGSIIFVDNEEIFKDVIMRESYNEYFRDMFGGDFGHCTQKGNRLLAENIADTILKEAFNKK